MSFKKYKNTFKINRKKISSNTRKPIKRKKLTNKLYGSKITRNKLHIKNTHKKCRKYKIVGGVRSRSLTAASRALTAAPKARSATEKNTSQDAGEDGEMTRKKQVAAKQGEEADVFSFINALLETHYRDTFNLRFILNNAIRSLWKGSSYIPGLSMFKKYLPQSSRKHIPIIKKFLLSKVPPNIESKLSSDKKFIDKKFIIKLMLELYIKNKSLDVPPYKAVEKAAAEKAAAAAKAAEEKRIDEEWEAVLGGTSEETGVTAAQAAVMGEAMMGAMAEAMEKVGAAEAEAEAATDGAAAEMAADGAKAEAEAAWAWNKKEEDYGVNMDADKVAQKEGGINFDTKVVFLIGIESKEYTTSTKYIFYIELITITDSSKKNLGIYQYQKAIDFGTRLINMFLSSPTNIVKLLHKNKVKNINKLTESMKKLQNEKLLPKFLDDKWPVKPADIILPDRAESTVNQNLQKSILQFFNNLHEITPELKPYYNIHKVEETYAEWARAMAATGLDNTRQWMEAARQRAAAAAAAVAARLPTRR